MKMSGGLSPFQLAMIETAMEDAAGKPCMGCGEPGERAAIWVPTATCLARDFGVTDGRHKAVVYPLCRRCERKGRKSKAFVARVENAVIASVRGAG